MDIFDIFAAASFVYTVYSNLAATEPLRMEEQKTRHLTLQLILTQSRGMTVNEIKASNKQEVNAPSNFNDMKEQLRMFSVANDIFLGPLSFGSCALCSLQTLVENSRSTFKAQERLDEEFNSKFLYAIDLRMQTWLKQCKTAAVRHEVDDNIINFYPLISEVLFGSFHINLPPTFKIKDPAADNTTATASATGKKDNSRTFGNKEGRNNKKKKSDDRSVIKNDSPHPKICMLTNEMWAINFASKHLDKCPKWNDTCHCCCRWFLQKYCFSDCKNKESHVKANEVSAENLANMKAWVKLCRSGN
jgi:hypothetical protein